jgi:hypothetical protein
MPVGVDCSWAAKGYAAALFHPEEPPVTASIYAMPIRVGKRDEFRALVTELMGPRRIEWAESHRRRGVTRQAVFIGSIDGRDVAMIFSESPDPERAFTAIAASDHPFDRWLAQRMSELLEARIAVESLADTAPKPGPWRGWRRFGR